MKRTGGETYLSEDGCGIHNDNTPDHKVVVEMWAGAVCAIEDDELCTSLMAELEQLAGRYGARVLVPDAHVSLGLRRNRDVMIAHLKLWQHFSVNDPDLGRFGTAVHIA